MRGASPVELAASVLVLVSPADVLESPRPVEPWVVEVSVAAVAELVGVLVGGGSPVPLVDELVPITTSTAGASPA